jgi:ubiquitin-like 1-activating enzyme E1 B
MSRQVYNADIRNLLSMEDMWRSRAPPIPLDFNAISKGKLNQGKQKATPDTTNSRSDPIRTRSRSRANGTAIPATAGAGNVVNGHAQPATSATGLKDQRMLTVQENLQLFISRWVATPIMNLSSFLISSTQHQSHRSSIAEGRGNSIV